MTTNIITRRWFQALCQTVALLFFNSHYNFLKTFSLYQGKLKAFCLPALNCTSCPLALYSCPLGAIQFFIMTGRMPVYPLSIIALTGVTTGRMSCGLLCPFGYLQDFLYKLGMVRIEVPKFLLYFKYVILVVLVFLLSFYLALPVFCKICPVGTLEAGFPLTLLDENVQGRLFNLASGGFTGWLFLLKTIFLTGILVTTVSIKRPFCRILCPLGALLGIFNKASVISLAVDDTKCDKCERCARMCPMDIDISSSPDSPECVRCLKCTSCESVSVSLRLIPLPFSKQCLKNQPAAK